MHNDSREILATSVCILATGHSARDTYTLLHRLGLELEAKPFAIGLRVEMPQEDIDASQRVSGFKSGPGEAASFRLSIPPMDGSRPCYTFCMCPGGLVIACASEPGRLTVNGMSYHARAGEWGNAAFLAPVTPEDFADIAGPDAGPLAGIAFQRHWEEKAYLAGKSGGDYAVPASRLIDFMERKQPSLPERRGVGRAVAADLGLLLPSEVAFSLSRAIPAMLSRLRRVDLSKVVLYGVESRTSSPVRITRRDDGMATRVAGLFPAGEGSGYAGGIMTSALDGWKAAGAAMAARTERG